MTNKFDRIHTNTKKKYKIKNCMCAYGFMNEPLYCIWKDTVPTHKTLCEDCTDCVLKQIIDNCRNIDCPCEYQGVDCWECSRIGAKTFADSIIKLLQIEEVE